MAIKRPAKPVEAAPKPTVDKRIVELTNERDRFRDRLYSTLDENHKLRAEVQRSRNRLLAVGEMLVAAATIKDSSDDIPF